MDPMSDPISDTKNDVPGSDGYRNRKDYQRELACLHVEFVKLEQWVVHKACKERAPSLGAGVPDPAK
jgi:hypothetical protein